MTHFLLVRHAAHDLLGRGVIAGRQPDVHLNACGKRQAEEIAAQLSILPIDAICCSPLDRARETAAPLARELGLRLQIEDAFNEIDFGTWTNCAFADLENVPEWKRWNLFRSSGAVPGGESMLAAQTRALAKIANLRTRHSAVAVFTHGDIIRAVLAHFLGIHLDHLHRIEIAPASTSMVELDQSCVRVRCLNIPAEGIKSFCPANATVC